jgi:hypothetical protein
MFRYSDETREIAKLIEKLGVRYETASIWDRGSVVPVYRIPNVDDNKVILETASIVNRLKDKIVSQEARIKELEAIKEDLEIELEGTTQSSHEKLSWSRAIDERLADSLSEKLLEFERILINTKRENEALKNLLREGGTVSPEILEESSDSTVITSDIANLREEVNLLKERLANMKEQSQESKELSYKVTKEITMKSGGSSVGMEMDLRPLVKALLASPDNWILFVLGTNQQLSKEKISQILGIPAEKRLDLTRKLNEYIDRRIIKVIETPEEELYQLDRWEWSDLIGSYTNTILGNKEGVPLDVKQLVRYILR